MTHLKLQKLQKGDYPSAHRLSVNVLLSNITFFDDVTRINFWFRLLVAWSSPHGRDASSHKVRWRHLYPVRSCWYFSEIQDGGFFKIIFIVLSRLDRGIQSATEMLAFEKGAGCCIGRVCRICVLHLFIILLASYYWRRQNTLLFADDVCELKRSSAFVLLSLLFVFCCRLANIDVNIYKR